MLKIVVTNESDSDATWQIEPYGDDVRVSPNEHLAVSFDHPTEVLIELNLRGTGTVAWASIDDCVVVPTELELNGRSLWPSS